MLIRVCVYVFISSHTRNHTESYDVGKNELTLQCVVSGDRPKITWFKDNYHISNNRYAASEDYGGIRRLTISDPVPSDFGCYTCRSDDGGRIDEISLTVACGTLAARSKRSSSKFHDRSIVRHISPEDDPDVSWMSSATSVHSRDTKRQPVFSTRLTDRTAAENTSIKLTCQIIGVDVCVEWYHNQVRLNGNPRFACRLRDGLATLEVFSARPSDTGRYMCKALNAFGEDVCAGHLRVFAGHERRAMPPIFTRAVKGTLFAPF